MCVFFKSYENCLLLLFMFNLDCFNPYTTEVHREYVAVAGHGAWLAVLFCKEIFFFFFFFFLFFLQIGPPLQCYLYCRMILTHPEKLKRGLL